MLYNGSEVIRDLEWVIFDEVHYINDAEVRSASFYSTDWLFVLFSIAFAATLTCRTVKALMSSFITDSHFERASLCFLSVSERGCVGGSAYHAA